MTTGQVQALRRALEAAFGAAIPVAGDESVEAVWSIGEVELGLSVSLPERRMRAAWRARQSNRGVPLLLVSSGAAAVRVLGPGGDEPLRELPAQALIDALAEIRSMPRRQAAATLSEVLERRDRAGIPGVIVRGLLTKHVLARRLRRDHPEDWQRLSEAAEKVRADRDWRQNLTALGYQTEELKERSHLLRYKDRPVAVVLPLSDAGAFSRATEEGSLPEGLLISDCLREGVEWGVLAAQGRFRLFPAKTSVGAATGRFLEIDVVDTQADDWPYIGLLAPESLIPGGLLERLLEESASLGAELRDSVEQQIRDVVLPAIARGLGDYAAGPKRNLSLENPDTRKLLEDAALLLMFRMLFFLYLESRGFLPLASPSYRPHSATQLLQDARAESDGFDERATALWDRHATLVHAMRTGNTAWGLPAYNGDLFSDSALVGAEFLEEAKLTDDWFGTALDALAFDPEGGAGGVDYGDLEVSHLGLIYEGLLSLRLSLADEPLVYDERTDRFTSAPKKVEPEVRAGELFYQTTSGGRKAAGVYYTPQVIVRHLVDHAVIPALDEHLARVAMVADRDPKRAAEMLFDFRVLDPAMGSAHFLADALDRIAERIGTFLADHPLKPIIKMLDDLRAEAKWDGRIEDGDLFRRLVLKRCIFGVDLSGMAVEVAKVSLWLASFVPGLSLSYLGHNLRQGDALIGVADAGVLEDLGPLFASHPGAPIPRALLKARQVAGRISAGLDRTPEEVEESRAAEAEMNEITDGLVGVFDLWCAEPFGVKGARGWLTTGAADKVLSGEDAKGSVTYLEPTEVMARDMSFFHWPAEFPEVFMRDPDQGFPSDLSSDAGRLFPGSSTGGQVGLSEVETVRPGFDVVIGNPPWEELTIEELGFYALHDPGARGIKAESERRQRIEDLIARYPELQHEFEQRQHSLAAKRGFFGPQGGYVAQGSGDTDLYKLFCERYRSLTRTGGWLGVVLPRSAFLVDGARSFRTWLFRGSEVRGLDFILNAGRWAFDMEPRYTFALLSAKRAVPSDGTQIRLSGPSVSLVEFDRAASGPGVVVGQQQLGAWTGTKAGSTYEVPLLPTESSVRVFDKMRGGPNFADGYGEVWSAFPVRELDETNDRKFFRHPDGVPVWKGRSLDQYNPHGADPAGYAEASETLARLQKKRTSTQSAFRKRFPAEFLADRKTHPYYSARVAFRDVSRATDSRTVRACLVPPEVFLTNKAPYLVFDRGGVLEQAFVLGVMNSLPFDWQARRLVELTMNFFIMNMLRLPVPERVDMEAIAERAARLSCVDERFASFAGEVAVAAGPVEDEEYGRLTAEIDAFVAQAYGLDVDDLEVVFSDFTESAVSLAHRGLVRKAFLDA